MKEAKIPENEEERLQFLHGINMLDTPIEERFERITRLVCKVLDVPIAAISLVDRTRQYFKSIQGLDVSEAPRSVSFCAHAILGNGALVIDDATKDERFDDNPFVRGDPNIRFYAGYPIHLGKDIKVGTLCAIDYNPRHIEKDKLDMLKDLAKIVETEFAVEALSQASCQLVTELGEAKRSSLIDPLSKVWNRKGIETLLEKEWEFCKRKSLPLSVVFLDIDDFKNVNDTHGHNAGDETIRKAARAIVSSVRNCDSVGRWGGDEFIAVLPTCSATDLKRVVESIDSAVNFRSVDERYNLLRKSPYTMSIGAACIVPSASNDLASLIKKADEAMYKAKNAGKGRFEITE